MQNVSKKLWALAGIFSFLLSAQISPAEAKWNGHVRKSESKRLTRPLQDFADLGETRSLQPSLAKTDVKLNALVNDDHFGIGINDEQSGQAAAVTQWPERLASKTSSIALPARAEQTETPINYAAIEQAYADAAPQHPVISSAQATGTNMNPSLAATAAANNARAQALASGAAAHGVDLDLCACHTVIPTSGCMQNRTVGVYAPNNGTVAPPTMRPTSIYSPTANQVAAPSAATSMPGVQLSGMPPARAIPGAMQLGVRLGR